MTALVSGLVGLGIVLRLGFLGADSLWNDEVFSVVLALGHSATDLWQTVWDWAHPPLFYVILRETLRFTGTSETTARIPSALASVCNLGLLFVLARRLDMTWRAASAAVLLLALAPIDVWYAQEARMYALVTTAGLAFAIGLTMNSWAGAVLAAAGLTAGLYLDFTLVPLSAALTSLWFVRWWHTERSVSQLVRVFVASSFAWWCFRPRLTQLAEVVRRLDGVTLFARLEQLLGLRISPGRATIAALVVITIGLGIVTSAIWKALRKSRFREWWTWVTGASFVVVTAALTVPRGYSAKQVLVTGWPFVVLVTAWTLTDLACETGRRRENATLERLRLPVAVGVSLVAAIAVVATPRADWRGVVAYLNHRAPTTSVVWLDPVWDTIPYDYYQPKRAAVTNPLASANLPDGPDSHAMDVCLVAERYGVTPPTSPSEAWLESHRRLVDVTPFARLQVRCYTRR